MRATSVVSRPRHLVWWWAALLLAVMGVIEYWFFVTQRPGQWADQVAFAAWTRWWPRTGLDSPVRDFLDLLPTLCAAIATVFLIYRVIRDRRFSRAMLASVAVVAAVGSTQLLKHVLLVRPDYNFGTTMNSFPSGHTTTAAAAMALMYVVSPPKLRPVIGPVAWGFATITGLATLISGWHRPSDIAAGFMVAGFWMVAACAVLQVGQPLSARVRPSRWSRRVGIASLVCWALVIMLSWVLPHPHIQQVPSWLLALYAALGVVHIIATALVVGLCLRSVVLGPSRRKARHR
ncbi:phosphatase PAP2 family protein [Glutamicibacter sp. MNS18]|uniref:phosphatase PAP2 family protein n=1 Tax=Glutamicibacter sp. MNS18 TaxID=2989817 RepID=UPI0022360B93|nr:phosphatase PAP2 family protein [Glutamicibacter sp. MNS18]MCW4464081.1 phosphatase PAP2 family protein [Glutamicibacter sp. MNS18]